MPGSPIDEPDPNIQSGSGNAHPAAERDDGGVDEAAPTSVDDTDADPGGLGALSGLSEQVRSTAKWLIGAFAAVGVLLVPGLQLANLGALSGGRLAWALVSALVGIAAVIAATGIITRVVTVSSPSYAELVCREKREAKADPLLKVLNANKTLLQAEAASIEELRAKYGQAIAQRERAYAILDPGPAGVKGGAAAAQPDPEEVERMSRHLQSAEAKGDTLRPILDQLSGVAEFQDIRHEFLRSQWWVAGLTVLAAGALVSFALAVHTPGHATSDFSHARLAHLDLSGANLEDADFSDTQLTGVDLHGSDLKDANFSGAHLTKVNLADAVTSGVKSDGAVLTMSTCVNGTLDGPPTTTNAAANTTVSSHSSKTASTKSCFSPRPLKPPIGDVTTDLSHGSG
jgi:Pentapeptide repeats (8 copies)